MCERRERERKCRRVKEEEGFREGGKRRERERTREGK